MTTFDPYMAFKEWTPDQVRELVQLAKDRGISQRELAREYVGCTAQSITYWLNPASGKTPSDMARSALSYAELRIKKVKEQ